MLDASAVLASDERGPRDDALAVDVEAVGQIVLNLVDNACKYGASSGSPRVDVTWSAPPGRLRVEVRDHGPGVDAGRRRTVFAPFDRGGRDDGSVPGIGLGLALSRGLARGLGGDVTLASGDGPGALFSLELEGGYEAGRTLMDSVKLMTLAVSLGGIETLIQHRASMTHAGMTRQAREQAGITDGLVRLSIGCEDIEDLQGDLQQALDRV